MKTAFIILTVISGVLLASTLICGLWIKAQEEVEASSVDFHMGLALVTIAAVVATLGVAFKEVAA